ncbi:hypothetical protein F2Q70_00020934 [Brassica cretica]|uniref:Uncharacterized protein n=1 Tax=Brassica cretica TaxID=69181 RepID=A0A8S9GSL7_BRACR|nr:hypothetical protein F2Q70_00020934 [Brassica cretica]
MNTSRRHSYGVPSRCWCGKGVVLFLFALHKCLSGVGVSIRVLGVTYETKAARPLAPGTNTPSKTLESRSGQDRARSAARVQKEEVKSASGATSRSEVRHPLRAQPLLDNFREVERPLGARSITRTQNEGTKLTSGVTWKQSDLAE